MGSATRSALQTATDALSERTTVTLTDGEQLLAAARAIHSSAQLRTLLTDPTIPAEAKARLVSSVFGAYGGTVTETLVAASGSRWSSAADFVDAIEHLGIRAVAASAPKDDVEGELFVFGRAVAGDAELELAIGAKLGDPAGKVALVDALLDGRASAATVAIARHLVQSPRGRRVGELFAQAADAVASVSGRIVATVTSASPLSATQRTRLSEALQKRYGRTPQINTVLDPAVVGGLRVQVADDVIDGTVAARLRDLRTRLAG